MIKGMILGVLVMLGMVGYGVIDTDDIQTAGLHVKTGVNNAAQWVKEKTEPSIVERVVAQ